jgi:hypothetical protein
MSVSADQQRDLSSQPLRYSFRPSVFGAPWEFSLTPAGLAWSVGRRSGRVPYGQIRKIRLSFRPLTLQGQRYLVEIWPEQGAKLTMSSLSWKSMIEQERQDEAYRAFVAALHEKLRAAGATARFECGLPVYLYWPGIVIFALANAVFAVLAMRAALAGSYGAAAFVGGFLALFGWRIGRYFLDNRPGLYRPDALPAMLVPRA